VTVEAWRQNLIDRCKRYWNRQRYGSSLGIWSLWAVADLD